MAYSLTSDTEKATIVTAAINTGGEVPAIVYMSIPSERQALLPDVNTSSGRSSGSADHGWPGPAAQNVARHVLDAVDEAGLQAVRLAAPRCRGTPAEQLAEHHGDLAAGQVGAQAEVRPRAAEPDVRVGVAGDVEAVGSSNTASSRLAAQ